MTGTVQNRIAYKRYNTIKLRHTRESDYVIQENRYHTKESDYIIQKNRITTYKRIGLQHTRDSDYNIRENMVAIQPNKTERLLTEREENSLQTLRQTELSVYLTLNKAVRLKM